MMCSRQDFNKFKRLNKREAGSNAFGQMKDFLEITNKISLFGSFKSYTQVTNFENPFKPFKPRNFRRQHKSSITHYKESIQERFRNTDH